MNEQRISLKLPKACAWREGKLVLLDQTRLPGKVVFEEQHSVEQVWDSIKQLKVRGAPAIGIAGAYGLLTGLGEWKNAPRDQFLKKLKEYRDYLDSARPTAVNLGWALKRMVLKAEESNGNTSLELYSLLEQEAIAIHEEDIDCCNAIGRHGEGLVEEGMGIMTHCNAGALAVSELGTALAPIYYAFDRGKKPRVYSCETRPLLQGARLTSWELFEQGVDVFLICDNMAASIMSQGLVQMVIVGADRVAANGDAANKIGTLGLGILAKHFKIPFYVACPFSTIDFATPNGEQIQIEQRKSEEITHIRGVEIAPKGIRTLNPAFDVTPKELIDGIITEKGIFRAPLGENLKAAYK